MTRIRYTKNESQLISVKPILCNNRFVKVTIDTEKMRYKITDTVSKEVIIQGVGVDIHSMKRKAKQDLRSIGAVFLHEVRNKDGERKLIIETKNN